MAGGDGAEKWAGGIVCGEGTRPLLYKSRGIIWDLPEISGGISNLVKVKRNVNGEGWSLIIISRWNVLGMGSWE
jgi:hypothetical protein